GPPAGQRIFNRLDAGDRALVCQQSWNIPESELFKIWQKNTAHGLGGVLKSGTSLIVIFFGIRRLADPDRIHDDQKNALGHTLPYSISIIIVSLPPAGLAASCIFLMSAGVMFTLRVTTDSWARILI